MEQGREGGKGLGRGIAGSRPICKGSVSMIKGSKPEIWDLISFKHANGSVTDGDAYRKVPVMNRDTYKNTQTQA